MSMKLAVEMCISVGIAVIQSRSLCVGQRRFPIFEHFCALRSLKSVAGDSEYLGTLWL